MAVIIPQEFADKSRTELYEDIESLARYVQSLKTQIEDLQGEIKIRDARITKQRGDILQLKSMIGHQNIHINNLETKSETIDVDYEEGN